jgi:hypothetical protein
MKIMKKLIVLLAVIFASVSFASTGTISKVKGNRALVTFDGPVKEGEKCDTNTEAKKSDDDFLLDEPSTNTRSKSFKWAKSSRKNVFIYNIYAGSSTQSPGSTSSTYIGQGSNLLSLAYLWVFDNWELGPQIQAAYISGSSSGTSNSSNSLYYGVIGYYDFTQNKPGVESIPAVFARLVPGTYSASAGSVTVSGSTFVYGVGFDYSWYIVDRIAVSAAVEYDGGSQTASGTYVTTSNYTNTNLLVSTGFKLTF